MFDLYLTLSVIGLFFSIIFSSSEIALLLANPLQINVWNKQKNMRFFQWSEKIIEHKHDKPITFRWAYAAFNADL